MAALFSSLGPPSKRHVGCNLEVLIRCAHRAFHDPELARILATLVFALDVQVKFALTAWVSEAIHTQTVALDASDFAPFFVGRRSSYLP